jgi:hypothetical protein
LSVLTGSAVEPDTNDVPDVLSCASNIVDPNQPSENPPDVRRMGSDTTLLLDQPSREIWYRTTLAVAACSISWADGIDPCSICLAALDAS